MGEQVPLGRYLPSAVLCANTARRIQQVEPLARIIKGQDALALSILSALSAHTKVSPDDTNMPDQPTFDDLVETVAELCGCLLMPTAGANLAAGKALMRRKIKVAQARMAAKSTM